MIIKVNVSFINISCCYDSLDYQRGNHIHYILPTFNAGILFGVLFFCGTTNLSRPGPPHCRASRSLSDTANSVGLLWTSDQPEAEASTLHHRTFTRERERDTHAPGWIRTRNPTKNERPQSHFLERAAIGISRLAC